MISLSQIFYLFFIKIIYTVYYKYILWKGNQPLHVVKEDQGFKGPQEHAVHQGFKGPQEHAVHQGLKGHQGDEEHQGFKGPQEEEGKQGFKGPQEEEGKQGKE